MSISNDQIYDALLGIKGDIGSLQATVEQHQFAFAKHVTEDLVVAQDVTKIRLHLAKQAGAARTWGLIATAAGTLAGGVAGFFGFHHHG